MRALALTAALLGAATTLPAQGASPAPASAAKPAVNAPAGWAARFDRASADPSRVTFVTTADGFHFVTGPSATWYRPGERLEGLYSVEATFTQTKAPQHPEAYGLVVMGDNLETPTQSYVYFMVRGDGSWAMKHRASDTEVHTVQDWVAHPAVAKQDAAGKATNTLRVSVEADSVRYLINGQQVSAQARQYLGGAKGVAGIRMNHGLDVQVTGWRVTRKE